MEPEWIPVSEEPFPEFTPENGKDFLAAWIDDSGEILHIEGIEWYTCVGGDLWNQNSNNLNDFFTNKDGPTHWMLVPRKIRK